MPPYQIRICDSCFSEIDENELEFCNYCGKDLCYDCWIIHDCITKEDENGY